MLRVSNVVVCLLLYLACFLYNGSTQRIQAKEPYSTDNETLLRDIIDRKCTTTSDCSVSHSSCINGTCQCDPGYIFDGSFTACITVITAYGDDCQESLQCSAYLSRGGICRNGICVCAEGYYYIHGKCREYSGLLEKCQDDGDCYVNGDFQASRCINNVCNCSLGYYQREYRTCRPDAKEHDKKCIINNDCKGWINSTCNNYTCVTSKTHENTSRFLYNDNIDEKNTIKEGHSIEKKCRKDTDCKEFGNATCGSSNICRCNRANFFNKIRSKCIPELGEPCDVSANEIFIEDSECRNGTWYCKLEKVASKDNRKCETVTVQYNGACENDVQCYVFGPDAICKDKKCICNEKSRFNETELFCWTKRGIGESCHQDVDCHIDGIDTKLFCDTNKLCSCPTGTRATTNKTACVKDINGLGDICEIDNDCTKWIKNAKCTNMTCVCIDNYYELKKQCVPGLNSSCISNACCAAKNSVCKSNVCTCKEQYIAVSIDACIQALPYGEPCDKNIQCSTVTPNAICLPQPTPNSSSVCACPEGYHYKFEKCFKRKVLGMNCENLGECYLNSGVGAVCRNGQCACDWNYIQRNDTVCDFNGSNITTSIIGLVSLSFLLTNILI